MNGFSTNGKNALFRRPLMRTFGVVRRVKSVVWILTVSVVRDQIDEKEARFSGSIPRSRTGMNGTGSSSESGDKRWSMALGA